jgi:three-Cys-motif partner protein
LAKSPYMWESGQQPPVIKQHSIAKHEILRGYLVAYIQTLISSPHQDSFRLTLVDGFAGGGIYLHEAGGHEVLGSPIIMLEAVEEAAALVNLKRTKKVQLLVDFFFIEQDKRAAAVLRNQLVARGYGGQIGQSIHLLNTTFQSQSGSLIEFVRKKGRAARAIFLLDQYGYSEVPASLINAIMQQVKGAEVILTFAVDSFLNFIGDHQTSMGLLKRIGIPGLLRGRSIKDIKQSDSKWRFYIQSCLYQDLVTACGAAFYTPFFIRSTQGHGDYWLLHLSQRPRARDVMTRIHWEKNNLFIHYGGAGLNMFDMLGYVPKNDSDYTSQLGFCFDNPAKTASISTLTEQIPHFIYPDPDGMSFGELFATTCNSSPASADIYKEALGNLVQHKELEIIGPDGKRRKAASTIHDNDQILPPRQRSFVF